MLYFVIVMFLLSCAGHIESYERNIQHQINRTALIGETVILYCNETLNFNKDTVWYKDGTLIIMYSPVLNQTMTNYTSSRMQLDPQNPRKLQISDVQLSDAGLYSCFPFNTNWILTIKGHIESYERNIQHQINRTALIGETVILYCNETLNFNKDTGWHKDGTLIIMYSPVLNQTMTNYTSSRMQLDPQNPRKLQISDVQLSDAGLYSCFPFNTNWILTIKERSSYIVFSAFTLGLLVCLFIFCAACLHGKWKEKSTCTPTETGNELAKTNKDSAYHNETICVYTMTSSDNFSTG